MPPLLLPLHGGEPHLFAALWRWWTWDPLVLVPLALAGGGYAFGARRLWRRAGAGQGVRRWEAAAFAGGWLALFVALVSPLDALGGVLFSAHMTQHELLMLVAAPLLVAGRPLGPWLWALPEPWRERLGALARERWFAAGWRAATGALTVWLLHGLARWLWHLPALYQATLESELVHFLQHASFLGTALLFWWALVHGRYGRMGYGVSVLYVFTTGTHSGVLGALITFAPGLWYPLYEERTRRWGLSPLEDQQLAGLVMWVPAGALFLVLGLALFAAWMGEAERRARLADWQRLRLPRGPAALLLALAALAAAACGRGAAEQARQLTGGEPERGRAAIRAYGCGTCHNVPGVRGARGLVGPPLDRLGSRAYLAGRLPNSPDNLMLWIRHPQRVSPGTAMPDMGIGDRDARDIAAYLYTLR